MTTDNERGRAGVDPRVFGDAAAAFAAIAEGPATELDAAFARVSESIGDHLEGAARRGELSFRAMADAARDALTDGVIENAGAGPLAAALNALAGGVFAGARADGGSVTSGGAYLVGERGPEVFTPAQSGDVAPLRAPSVSVTMNFAAGADAESVRRSEAQITGLIARAVARGQREL